MNKSQIVVLTLLSCAIAGLYFQGRKATTSEGSSIGRMIFDKPVWNGRESKTEQIAVAEPPRMPLHFDQIDQGNTIRRDPQNIVPVAYYSPFAAEPAQVESLTDESATRPRWKWPKESLSEGVWLRTGSTVTIKFPNVDEASYELGPIAKQKGFAIIGASKTSFVVPSGTHEITATLEGAVATLEISQSGQGLVLRSSTNSNSLSAPEPIRTQFGMNWPWESYAATRSIFRRTTVIQEVRVFSSRDVARAVVLAPIDATQAIVLGVIKQQSSTEIREANDFRSTLKVDTSPLFKITTAIEVNFFSEQDTPVDNYKFSAGTLKLTSDASSASTSAKPVITQIYGVSTSSSSTLSLSGNSNNKTVVVTGQINPSVATALYIDGNFKQSLPNTSNSLNFASVDLPEGPNHYLSAKLLEGDDEKNADDLKSVLYPFEKRTNDFIVTNVGPKDYGVRLGADRLEVTFSRPISSPSAEELRANPASYLSIERSESGTSEGPFQSTSVSTGSVTFAGGNAKLIVAVTPTTAGLYRLTLTSAKISDSFGNKLSGNNGKTGENYESLVGQATANSIFSEPLVAGVNRGNAPVVEYPSVIPSNEQARGFNQNDRVETRVARLYFYRDAHRVAQILNRRAQSYNRQDVTMRKQMADKSRQETDSRITKRQISERTAVEKAKRTRELENQLSDTQRTLNYSLQQMQQLAVQPASDKDAARSKEAQITQLEIAARSSAEQVRALESKIESARDTEVDFNERWQQDQRSEELSRAEQFRLETAAAHIDPDTFAEGKPNSIDAVHQVSISVIGEGVLHLRGPLRGVNQVRMMVDQIDSPCGQVRVNVHSTQINGEAPDELETVANRIQTYIDQARFLTLQSGEMLRKAVLHIAAARAEEARGLYPGESQADRDQRYLVAFFGKDFVDELRSMDSEFLQTGNKLLSLHSMDVTSLSSALTMIALANNGTRMAIWQEFERLIQSDLPMAEQQFLRNSIAECTTKKCKHGCKGTCKHNQPPPVFQLTGNATFTGLRGFFDANVPHDDTMTPLQREVIRLSQILKSRLVTEMELKQRVMERAVIEERMGAVENEADQLNREKAATELLRNATQETITIRSNLLPSLTLATSAIETQKIDQYKETTRKVLDDFKKITSLIFEENNNGDPEFPLQLLSSMIEGNKLWRSKEFEILEKKKEKKEGLVPLGVVQDPNTKIRLELWAEMKESPATLSDDQIYLVGSSQQRRELYQSVNSVLIRLNAIKDKLADTNSEGRDSKTIIDHLTTRFLQIKNNTVGLQVPGKDKYAIITITDLQNAVRDITKLVGRQKQMTTNYDELILARQLLLSQNTLTFEGNNVDALSINAATKLLQEWLAFRQKVENYYSQNVPTNLSIELENASRNFKSWYTAVSKLNAARSIAQSVRRPLDHKKFLDMLIDDLEEKYIELLEGTRAHTANIDNYLKRITTSLDDDFNTQFYYPAFRSVRKASQNYKVEFGQTETTNVLANNRELAKVSPSATMEFDLPKRGILIKEGIDSALAIYNDVGALVNDPNLLSLAKMQSGQSTASPGAGSLGGYGAVRNVYPGLGNDTTNRLVSQNAGSGPQFESNIEKLIPDPAIYKFETGTGYEIRPVIAPDGQAVVFDFNYMYTTQVREPVRADEKHLGRIKQHYIDTDVQLSNFELREVSRYVVALKAARTAKGVPLLEDIPVVGALWRPLPSDEKSLQQNIIMAQATIFPTLFDLMGLRWAPAVADLDPMRLSNREYLVRNRNKFLENQIYDYSSAKVDEFLRVPEPARRADLYRSQETIPQLHPNGYQGPGLNIEVSPMRNGYDPQVQSRSDLNVPSASPEGALYPSNRNNDLRGDGSRSGQPPSGAFIEDVPPMRLDGPADRRGGSLPPPSPKANSGWEYSRPR